MEQNDDIDFNDLLEDYDGEYDEWDDWEEELSFEEEHRYDGLDEGFSSWQDYYNYMYG